MTNSSTTGPTGPLPKVRRLLFHLPWPGSVILLLVLLLLGVSIWWAVHTFLVQSDGPLTASGTLEADEILLSFEVSGRITELVEEGQEVQSGDIVARLGDSLIQLRVRQALDSATQQQLLVEAARYQLHSPVSGVVTRVPTHVGEVVSPGETVAAVSNLSRLKLTAYVLERDLGQVKVGQRVAVTVDPFPDRTFAGVVTSINSQAEFTPRNVQTRADRLNLVFGVKVQVDNPDGALKPGMPADATFIQAIPAP